MGAFSQDEAADRKLRQLAQFRKPAAATQRAMIVLTPNRAISSALCSLSFQFLRVQLCYLVSQSKHD
jgi:hypothetical protein